MKESVEQKESGQPKGPTLRRWRTSIVWAAVLVGAGVAISATVNPLLGRTIHWDWMAGLAPTLFIMLAVAIRRRWV